MGADAGWLALCRGLYGTEGSPGLPPKLATFRSEEELR